MKDNGNGQLMLESRREVELLQNALELAVASGQCNDMETSVAKEASAILEGMWYSW